MSQAAAGAPRKKRRAQHKNAGRRREATSAGQLVADTLSAYGLTEKIRSYRVVAEWDQLVGERIAKRARPEGVVRRVLVVRVASSAWMHELGLLKQQLLAALWRATGEPRLFDDLSFQLAGRTRADKDDPGSPPARRPPPPQPVMPMAAGELERAQILEESAVVEDSELRELIARVRTRHNR
ncbi:MAG: DUF721 domain-containing protein [Myxococcales bacterium]|nr:DUF721 domain-containing protein [Myxococcales bacterium]